MATIRSKVPGYNGVTAGVLFTDGVGKTTNKWLLQWFAENGYTVESGKPGKEE